MTIKDFLIQEYKKTLSEIKDRPDYEEELEVRNLNNYLNTITSIGMFLQEYQKSKMIPEVDRKYRYEAWVEVLHDLLERCILEQVKPRTEITELGYGFNEFGEYKVEQQLIAQFLESYIAHQIPRVDTIGWIELGIKFKLIELTNY